MDCFWADDETNNRRLRRLAVKGSHATIRVQPKMTKEEVETVTRKILEMKAGSAKKALKKMYHPTDPNTTGIS